MNQFDIWYKSLDEDQPDARTLSTQDSTTQKDEDIQTLSGILTHDPSIQADNTRTSDHAATMISFVMIMTMMMSCFFFFFLAGSSSERPVTI
jgi:hypothetical protein